MKRKPLYVRLLIWVVFLFASLGVYPQSEVVNFIKGGVADGEKLIQAYLEPLGDGMGANLNGGWYNTAKVHKVLGFDITLTLTAAFPPEHAKTFDINALGLQSLKLKNPSNSIAPTIAGSQNKGPVLEMQRPGSGTALFEFESISGLDIPLYPLPMIKGAIGMPKGIEIKGRFIPHFSYEDMSIGLWGAGLKYDLLQHIPAVNKVPFLNASVLAAFTRVSSSAAVDFQRSIYEEHIVSIPIVGGKDNYENQEIEINMRGYTGMLLVSYDLPIISLYGGMGYSRAMTSVDLLGYYPMISGLEQDQQTVHDSIHLDDVHNPISLSFDNFSGLQYTAGLRLKILVVSIHADITHANYNMFSIGLGLTVR